MVILFICSSDKHSAMLDRLGTGSKVVIGIATAAALKFTIAWLMTESRRKRFEKVGVVTGLVVYPLKSCKGVYVKEGECVKKGLKVKDVPDR